MNTTNVIAAFSEEQAQRLSGLSQSLLRYWDRTDFFSPSFARGELAGAFGRIYSFRDIVALRVLAVLRQQYRVPVQHLRNVKEKLRVLREDTTAESDLWTGVKLYVFNHRVHWVGPNEKLPSDIVSGQYLVPTIVFDQIVNQTMGDAKAINQRRSETVGQIERVRQVNQRSAVIAGTRVPVRAIQRFSAAGYNANQILKEYPDLTIEDIEAALAYRQAA